MNQSQSVNVSIAPSTATAQAIAATNNYLGRGGQNYPIAPQNTVFPGDGQSHGYGQGGYIDVTPIPESYAPQSKQYGPPAPNFTPYNNGDYSTQQGGQLGPYSGMDANGGVARIYAGNPGYNDVQAQPEGQGIYRQGADGVYRLQGSDSYGQGYQPELGTSAAMMQYYQQLAANGGGYGTLGGPNLTAGESNTLRDYQPYADSGDY